MASVYENMTHVQKKAAKYLKELNLLWIHEFPVFVYDDKKRPRLWAPDFYIPRLGIYIEVFENEQPENDFKEKILEENGYHIIFLHIYKEQYLWKKNLVRNLIEIENNRHFEIKKIERQPIKESKPINNEKNLQIEKDKSIFKDEIMKIYPRAYEPWTSKEDQQLISEYKHGKSIPQLGITHQRKSGAIRIRLKKLRLISE